MATITASLERSLQNCSLNQTTRTRRGSGGAVGRSSSSSDSPETINHQIKSNRNNNNNNKTVSAKEDSVTESNASSSDDNSTFVQLNSHLSLPYHWEQCLDLKTGELYYINWSNGMKAKEDPRTTSTGYNGDYYSEDDEDEDDEEDEDDDDEEEEEESNCYDSEGSSTESSPCWSTRKDNNFRTIKKHQELKQDSVLVVAGCKSCLMYYMVAKHVEDCPKCSGQLLHFAANNSSP